MGGYVEEMFLEKSLRFFRCNSSLGDMGSSPIYSLTLLTINIYACLRGILPTVAALVSAVLEIHEVCGLNSFGRHK